MKHLFTDWKSRIRRERGLGISHGISDVEVGPDVEDASLCRPQNVGKRHWSLTAVPCSSDEVAFSGIRTWFCSFHNLMIQEGVFSESNVRTSMRQLQMARQLANIENSTGSKSFIRITVA